MGSGESCRAALGGYTFKPGFFMTTYCEAILEAHRWLMRERSEVFCIGQGVWSPWYVGNSMRDLEKDFGVERVIDTPVSEAATTSAALGAALGGYRPIVVHPRMDFAVLAMDAIVNQAANWNHMFGGGISVPLTVRMIINRGGEQGAQHSQALHAWLAHVPGLRVVMPATPADARDLLIASVLSDDPVVYIDDRWLYEREAELDEIAPVDLRDIRPRVRREGSDLTLVGTGNGAAMCEEAAELLEHFQWKNANECEEHVQTNRESVADEMADVAIYLFELADLLEMDLGQEMLRKLKKNAVKYPVEKAKGTNKKYNELG